VEAVAAVSRGKRVAYVSLGILSVTIGTIGIFVPGLPTTIFLLAASWFFARSSPSLYARLHGNPRLSAFLKGSRDGRLPVRTRVLSIVGIWSGIALTIVFGEVESAVMRGVLILLGAIGTIAVLRGRV
jgi:uncharacterized membrane protein YbaN (DUF454 family)